MNRNSLERLSLIHIFKDAKVAVIYNSSDVYSSGIYEKFSAEADVKGVNVVTAQAFTKDSATDFTVQLQDVYKRQV